MFSVSWVSLFAVAAILIPGAVLLFSLEVSDRSCTGVTIALTTIAWAGFVLGLDRSWMIFQPMICLIAVATTASLAMLTCRSPMRTLMIGLLGLVGICWRVAVVFYWTGAVS